MIKTKRNKLNKHLDLHSTRSMARSSSVAHSSDTHAWTIVKKTTRNDRKPIKSAFNVYGRCFNQHIVNLRWWLERDDDINWTYMHVACVALATNEESLLKFRLRPKTFSGTLNIFMAKENWSQLTDNTVNTVSDTHIQRIHCICNARRWSEEWRNRRRCDE